MKSRLLKTFVIFSLFFTFIMTPFTASAADATTISPVESLGEDFYYEIIIEEDIAPRGPVIPEQQITKTKTVNVKDNSGNILFSVSIRATFIFDGSSATCVSCTPSAQSYNSLWVVKNVTSNKNGNSATAIATLIRTTDAGNTQQSTKSVTITCSPTGVIS